MIEAVALKRLSHNGETFRKGARRSRNGVPLELDAHVFGILEARGMVKLAPPERKRRGEAPAAPEPVDVMTVQDATDAASDMPPVSGAAASDA